MPGASLPLVLVAAAVVFLAASPVAAAEYFVCDGGGCYDLVCFEPSRGHVGFSAGGSSASVMVSLGECS